MSSLRLALARPDAAAQKRALTRADPAQCKDCVHRFTVPDQQNGPDNPQPEGIVGCQSIALSASIRGGSYMSPTVVSGVRQSNHGVLQWLDVSQLKYGKGCHELESSLVCDSIRVLRNGHGWLQSESNRSVNEGYARRGALSGVGNVR